MGRISKAYRTQFRWLLQQVGARRLEQGVQWHVDRAGRLESALRIAESDALTRAYADLAAKWPFTRSKAGSEQAAAKHFFCDAGLGGLARWLRAAGYEAEWEPGIDDDDLLRRARELSATLLTADSMLMERRVLRDRVIPSLWLPPTLTIPEQLALVFRELRLRVGSPRCMSCGGELRRGDKEALRERIPPRTYRWLDEYFTCSRCGKLFWHGSHWGKILETLKTVSPNG